MSEVREGDDGAPADAQHVLQHDPRTLRRLQGLRENDIVEAVLGIIGEVRVRVALNDGQALGDAVVHAALRQLDAAAVDLTIAGQHLEEQPVAAADVEHAAPRRHHIGDDGEIGSLERATDHEAFARLGATPRALAAASRKPRVVAKKSGS